MTALRRRVRMLVAPEEDDAGPVRRSPRDWIVDCTLFLLAIMAGGATLSGNVEKGLDGALLAADAVGGLALCLALWGRRRWPVVLGLASVPILAFSSFAGPANSMILFTVAAYRRWQLAFLVAGLQLAVEPVYRALHPEDNWLSSGASYLVSILGTAAIVGWGMFWRGRRQGRRERQRRVQAEQQLRVEQIRYAERTRIAREMHDVLAHRISLLSLHAGALEFRPQAQPEEVARAAAVIRASAHQALEDLRGMIGLLRDRADNQSLRPAPPTLAALPELLEESRAAGMRVHSEVRLRDLAAVPEAIGRHALRIVQEALTNARKHAPSAAVDLRIEGAAGQGLTIEVRNPAPVLTAGEPGIPGSGTGLVGLSERATLSGGHLEHGLDEDGSFRLRAWLPWPK